MALASLKRVAFRTLRHLAHVRYRRSLRGQQTNCVLVLQYMLPLGGCVHATPLLHALQEAGVPVYVATRGLGLELLRHDPQITGLIETPDVFASLMNAGKALRAELQRRGLRPSWIMMDASNRRSRIAVLGALYSGAPMMGFNLAEDLQTVTLHSDPARSMIENNLQIAAHLGANSAAREPRLYCSAQQMAEGVALLAELNTELRPVVIVSTQPSGGQPTAWWPERWVPVVTHLATRGMLAVFVGTAAQAKAIDEIRAMCRVHTASAAGRTGVGVLAALLAQADLCISIDTGTLHVARAVDLPVVALAPTFQSPVEWLPLQWPKARVLRGEGIYPAARDYHLDEIEPAQVNAAMDDLLTLYPATTTSRDARCAAVVSDVDHLQR